MRMLLKKSLGFLRCQSTSTFMKTTSLLLFHLTVHSDKVWKNSLNVPLLVALVSASILVLQIVLSRRPVRQFWRRLRCRNVNFDEQVLSGPVLPAPLEATFAAEIEERARKHGGLAIFVFKLIRLAGCLVFLALSLYSAVLDEEARIALITRGKNARQKHTISRKELRDLGVCLASVRLGPSSKFPFVLLVS